MKARLTQGQLEVERATGWTWSVPTTPIFADAESAFGVSDVKIRDRFGVMKPMLPSNVKLKEGDKLKITFNEPDPFSPINMNGVLSIHTDGANVDVVVDRLLAPQDVEAIFKYYDGQNVTIREKDGLIGTSTPIPSAPPTEKVHPSHMPTLVDLGLLDDSPPWGASLLDFFATPAERYTHPGRGVVAAVTPKAKPKAEKTDEAFEMCQRLHGLTPASWQGEWRPQNQSQKPSYGFYGSVGAQIRPGRWGIEWEAECLNTGDMGGGGTPASALDDLVVRMLERREQYDDLTGAAER